jgi:hypothetical protein
VSSGASHKKGQHGRVSDPVWQTRFALIKITNFRENGDGSFTGEGSPERYTGIAGCAEGASLGMLSQILQNDIYCLLNTHCACRDANVASQTQCINNASDIAGTEYFIATGALLEKCISGLYACN